MLHARGYVFIYLLTNLTSTMACSPIMEYLADPWTPNAARQTGLCFFTPSSLHKRRDMLVGSSLSLHCAFLYIRNEGLFPVGGTERAVHEKLDRLDERERRRLLVCVLESARN